MRRIFLGTEAIDCGAVTPGGLRYGYTRVFPNVYVPRDQPPSLEERAVGAWLWSGRRAVITGRAAAALHGALWVAQDSPIELNYDNRRPLKGIIARDERIACDEVLQIVDMPVSTVARTAFDLGRFLPRGKAVAQLDSLARHTGFTAEQVLPLAEKYQGARGVKKLRRALDVMDAGAQSPRETWLRLLLIDKGFPRPTTQIPVFNGRGVPFAYLDMGWEDLKIAVEYDGDHHRKSRDQYVWDEQRLRLIRERGYLHIKVIKEDEPDDIEARVKQARALRERAFRVARRAC